MEISTMQQLRNEHRKSDGKLSLKAFAKSHGLEGIIERAHAAANKTRSPEKREKTRAASSARKTKKAGAKTVVKA